MDEWVVDGREVDAVAPAVVRARRPRAVLRPHPAGAADARRQPALSRRPTSAAYRESWNAGVRCAVMQGGQGDIKHWAFNDPPRREGRYTDVAAVARRVPRARDAHGRSAPHHDRAERAHQRRRQRHARADAGHDGRAGRDLAGGEGVDLARGQARQPVRAAADDADDLQAGGGHGRADVAARPSTRTCSSISTAAGSARARWRCTELLQRPTGGGRRAAGAGAGAATWLSA